MNNARPTGRNSANDTNSKFDAYIQMNADFKEKLYNSSHDDNIELTDYEKHLSVSDVCSLDLAFKFYKLSTIAVDIIMFLHFNGGMFEGNFSDLTVALGRKSGPKGHTPNIRTMCLKLQEQGILNITYSERLTKDNHARPVRFDLNPYWTKNL